MPPEQVAFIHDADTEIKKRELFAKVRAGQVRVLIGSTSKLGVGTNVQTRLLALHDLDCLWRSSAKGGLSVRETKMRRFMCADM